MPPALDLPAVRSHFPSLSGANGARAPIFFDNPGGTQVAQEVLEAVTDYYLHHNANHGGAFATSARSDAILHEAHAALADFLGAASPAEIVFGPNMTTLTFAVSRAIGRTLAPGAEIVVTHLDHDANIAPWLALQERGANVKWVDVHPGDCTLDRGSFEAALSERTKVVAVGYASNAVGTINAVKTLTEMAHAVGARVFIDAVQYAPHGPIDVIDLGCDLLTCSAYKFFGPHVGVLYGKYDLLDRLPAYKVRPAGNQPPDKFETGTQNHEGIAGTLGVLRYLEWVGGQVTGRQVEGKQVEGRQVEGKQVEGRQVTGRQEMEQQHRRQRLTAAMTAIKEYEQKLSRALIEGLSSIAGVKVWGITDPNRLEWRVPTVSFTWEGKSPRAIAEYLAAHDIYVWDGNYYALAIMERLDLQKSGGMVRVGAAHYNTLDEVARLIEVLSAMPR
ncbi:MAG TPA: cysteine desulfurase-like protein [Anaerolineae bacterium]|nr:cysteine desulfurase-like protein [Anaerolineae bacterium]